MISTSLRWITEARQFAWDKLRRLARRASPRAVVLMYHRVAEPSVDPWDLCVSPDHFSEHLKRLRKKGCVWPLSTYVQRFRRGVPPRRAVILTFDDGYVDNLQTALPLLDAHELSGTFFVPTGHLGSDRAFWWDTLATCVLHERPLPDRVVLDDPTAPQQSIRIAGEAMNSPDDRHQVYRKLWGALSGRTPEARRTLLEQLCEATGGPMEASSSRRPMTREEVADIGQHPDMELGVHTVSHTPLSALSAEKQRAELRQSRETLQELTDAPVSGLSYPNGAYDATTQATARDLGFTHACTTEWDAVTWATDPMALPRLHVRDVDADTLDEQISPLLA